MRSWIKVALCAAALGGAAAAAGGVAVGVNLEGVKDWSRLSPFTDLMKSARAWGLPEQPWVHQVPTDALGWPLGDAGVVVKVVDADVGDAQAVRRNLAPGVYRLSFQGRAARV